MGEHRNDLCQSSPRQLLIAPEPFTFNHYTFRRDRSLPILSRKDVRTQLFAQRVQNSLRCACASKDRSEDAGREAEGVSAKAWMQASGPRQRSWTASGPMAKADLNKFPQESLKRSAGERNAGIGAKATVLDCIGADA